MKTAQEKLPGLTMTTVTVDALLDHTNPAAGTIEVFARVVTADGGEGRPYAVFLQGGPGYESPRMSDNGLLWVKRMLRDYQVVLLDQRGTGRSTPVYSQVSTPGVAQLAGPLAGLDVPAQAAYLQHLRADGIVRDAELLRESLGIKRWTVLGQSFGGFTTIHYLSVHPESLDGALITGGLTPVNRPVDDIYAATWETMIGKSLAYYRRFPDDRDRVRELTVRCAQGEIVLPNGDLISPDRFRTIGHRLGAEGGIESLHYLLGLDHRTSAFKHDLAAILPFGGRNPLYAVLHESSYADGAVTGWSADRTMPERVRDDVTLLGGEHLHQTLFTEDTELRPFAAVADVIAQHQWNQLYFPDQLAQAQVPVAAVAYHDDAYVPLEYSLQTAQLLPDCRMWVTSEFEHNGLRMGADVIDRLLDLLHGRKWL